jgi:tripartite ATP-independent transporter DctM subunit
MLLAGTALIFVVLVALSVPIVFALGIAAVAGLGLGGFSLEMLASSLIGASQNWVLLAIPSFIFAGTVMERCGMSHALVDLARALVGWLRGGLGMSVIVVSYFFSDICGSKMAEVSALGSTLMPPLRRAGYRAEDGASLIASGTAMGMLVPPAIFLIVIGEVTNTSVVALFLAGFVPAAVIGVCLCVLVLVQAHLLGWPKDTRPSLRFLLQSLKDSAVPLVIPLVILGGFYFGAFTATEAGAIVALYALLAARLYYRNLTWRQIAQIAYDSAVLTAAVVFLLAVATIFQYLMGVTGVPVLLGELLKPLESAHWLFLLGVALITMLFGMVLEGLPAAVVLIPVVFPIAMRLGINPIHFDIVQTAAVGIGLFLPPMGVGLLMALRFAEVSVGQHARYYWPYVLALWVGLMLIICLPELSLAVPRIAGFVRN